MSAKDLASRVVEAELKRRPPVSEPLSTEACENCGAMIPGGREMDRLRTENARLAAQDMRCHGCMDVLRPDKPGCACTQNEEHAQYMEISLLKAEIDLATRIANGAPLDELANDYGGMGLETKPLALAVSRLTSEVSRLRQALRLDEPWSLLDAAVEVTKWAKVCYDQHRTDRQGWELLDQAVRAINDAAALAPQEASDE